MGTRTPLAKHLPPVVGSSIPAQTTCSRNRSEPYSIGEEATLTVGRQNVLNRLQAYTHLHGVPKGRRDRLRRTLADLYGRCSAGTHAEVTVEEARFVFLQTYVVLGEVLRLGGKEIDGPGE